jgi:hypothetical protein
VTLLKKTLLLNHLALPAADGAIRQPPGGDARRKAKLLLILGNFTIVSFMFVRDDSELYLKWFVICV